MRPLLSRHGRAVGKRMMKAYWVVAGLLACCLCGLPLPGKGDGVPGGPCFSSAEAHAALAKATAASLAHLFATEQDLALFRSLCACYPNNLCVHKRYQDAVQRSGTEGRLKALAEEYPALDAQHADTPMYRCLVLRSLVGYSTQSAIAGLTELAAQLPGFAPAHQTLAEIYGSAAFRDAAKANSERETLRLLCPRAALTPLLPSLPPPSPLVSQAGTLLAQHGDPVRIIAMTAEGLGDDEWRWQRIHPHDWYSDDYKRETLRELKAAYWQAWCIQVRCLRRVGQSGKAADLLSRMDTSAVSFLNDPGARYWDTLATLVQLYAAGGQPAQALQKLTAMDADLANHPDPHHAAQIKALRELIKTKEA